MNYNAWMPYAQELIDLAKEMPEDFVRSTIQYNSKFISFLYNSMNDSCTYKLKKPFKTTTSVTSSGTSLGMGHHFHQYQSPHTITGVPITMNTPGVSWTNPNPALYSTTTEDNTLQVSITVQNGKLLDLKFIVMTNGTTYLTYNNNNSDFMYEDGGTLHLSVLYLSESKIILNGKIYDVDNSPEAFNEDLMNDNMSILALHSMYEYYNKA